MSWQPDEENPASSPDLRLSNSWGSATTRAASGFSTGTSMMEMPWCGDGQIVASGCPAEEV